MSDTARMLDDTAERLLVRRLSDPFARNAAGLRAELLADLTEAGLPLVLAPEDAGGLGGTLGEAGVVAWRWGWHAAPLPITELLLLPTLSDTGAWERGEVALAFVPDLRLDAQRLQGGAIAAPAIGEVATILAPCQGEAGPVLVEIDAAGAETFRALSHEPWLRVTAADAVVRGTRPCRVDPTRIANQGALLTASAMAGAMARVLEIVIEHANTRKQFGRPLGKLQAVQHMIAEAASEQAVAGAALAAAIAAEDGRWGRPLLWQSAKVQAGRAATVVAAAAHQVLGAIGFTEEHVLHHYSKRLWGWRDEWGRQATLEAAIGRAACADPRGLWPHVADDAA